MKNNASFEDNYLEEFKFPKGSVTLNYFTGMIEIEFKKRLSNKAIGELGSKGFRWCPSTKTWWQPFAVTIIKEVEKMTGISFINFFPEVIPPDFQ